MLLDIFFNNNINSNKQQVLNHEILSCEKMSRDKSLVTINCKGIFTYKFRDEPSEKLLGGGVGNFRAAGIFFRYQIPCINIFKG